MNILFISHYSFPHIGGVEKHIDEISKILKKQGNNVSVISETNNVSYPHIKFLGLLKIWLEIFKLRKKIENADIVHIHDVFVWYLPFRFIYPKKKVYITFHGGQDIWPIPFKNKLMVKLAAKLTNGNICVGDFIPKYFDIKTDKVIYGAVKKINTKKKNLKLKNSIVWLGRLDKNTDLPGFLSYLKNNKKNLKVVFVGDGELKFECEEFGKVTGFVKDTSNYLKKAETVVPVGYLSYLEAKNYNCKIKTFPTTPIKKDYWKGIEKVKNIPIWEDIVKIYLNLWNLEQ